MPRPAVSLFGPHLASQAGWIAAGSTMPSRVARAEYYCQDIHIPGSHRMAQKISNYRFKAAVIAGVATRSQKELTLGHKAVSGLQRSGLVCKHTLRGKAPCYYSWPELESSSCRYISFTACLLYRVVRSMSKFARDNSRMRCRASKPSVAATIEQDENMASP